VHDNISFGGKKMAQVLTLGAGGDNQGHVTRPRTAKAGASSDMHNKLKRVNS